MRATTTALAPVALPPSRSATEHVADRTACERVALLALPVRRRDRCVAARRWQ